jgi:hypothetical protein
MEENKTIVFTKEEIEFQKSFFEKMVERLPGLLQRSLKEDIDEAREKLMDDKLISHLASSPEGKLLIDHVIENQISTLKETLSKKMVIANSILTKLKAASVLLLLLLSSFSLFAQEKSLLVTDWMEVIKKENEPLLKEVTLSENTAVPWTVSHQTEPVKIEPPRARYTPRPRSESGYNVRTFTVFNGSKVVSGQSTTTNYGGQRHTTVIIYPSWPK